MTNDDIIKLAEFCGVNHGKEHHQHWFQPHTDANDCEALIDKLRAKGWAIEISWQWSDQEDLAAVAFIHIWNRHTEQHERCSSGYVNYKQGVYELALRVIYDE